jgi:hypothetical protein
MSSNIQKLLRIASEEMKIGYQEEVSLRYEKCRTSQYDFLYDEQIVQALRSDSPPYYIRDTYFSADHEPAGKPSFCSSNALLSLTSTSRGTTA